MTSAARLPDYADTAFERWALRVEYLASAVLPRNGRGRPALPALDEALAAFAAGRGPADYAGELVRTLGAPRAPTG